MYNYFRAGSVKPEGWLLEQLKIQKDGLSGNLDKIWPDIRDSAWIGGDKEGWERVPYWLDGFIPLAYLLGDKDMICRADKYIKSIIERQKSDGWICPCPDNARNEYDVWAYFLIGKVLAVYVDFTDDASVLNSLYRSMKCLYNEIKNEGIKLFNWGKFRWFECMIPLQFLYDRYKEEWIRELGKAVREQGVNFFDYIDDWRKPLNCWTYETHIVNLCMMFKYEAVSAKLFGEKYENKAEALWQELDKYNGTAFGGFTGDECLAGVANNRGTELCSVVELMYSCELLYAITRNPVWADRLEKLAFNALPATISDDMWTHQYVQMVNQIACIRFPGKSYFGTNNSEAHIFGLEPHFGCCTANHNQGWPKLAMFSFLKSENGIHIAALLPSTLKTEVNGVPVEVRIETEYPFRHSAKITVESKEKVKFPLTVRIPSWVKSLRINGADHKPDDCCEIERIWSGKYSFTFDFTDIPHFQSRPHNLKTAQYGPIIFSLPVLTEYKKYEYLKDGVERKFPYCDYELIPKSDWRYGFIDEDLIPCYNAGDSIPFSSQKPRITLKAYMKKVEWDFEEGYNTVAARKPLSDNSACEAEQIELYPYGCAKLRMTEMPIVK